MEFLDRQGVHETKKYSSKFKSRVALEVLKGELTINEIAIEYKVHPNQTTFGRIL